ncbi:MAG: hypothetical protein KAS70_00045 [Planctomycetes bacterium]|nr:hypothetical protein [Planctomycetota bacterium]
MAKPTPIPLAMIICDTVIEDRRTGKKSLIGIFNNIMAVKMPVRHPSLNVFCILTEGIGQYEGSLRCTRLDNNEVVIDIKGPISFPNRLVTAEFNFDLKNVVFPAIGEYIFELLCDGNLVISRKFTISELKKEPDKPA